MPLLHLLSRLTFSASLHTHLSPVRLSQKVMSPLLRRVMTQACADPFVFVPQHTNASSAKPSSKLHSSTAWSSQLCKANLERAHWMIWPISQMWSSWWKGGRKKLKRVQTFEHRLNAFVLFSYSPSSPGRSPSLNQRRVHITAISGPDHFQCQKVHSPNLLKGNV